MRVTATDERAKVKPFARPTNGTVQRASTSDVYVGFEVITPAKAKEILDTRNVYNRNKSESLIGVYASEMLADQWWPMNNGIGFDVDGVLSDGQHRLEAIVMSGKTQELPVFYNLPKDARNVTDINRRRTIADNLKMHGKVNVNYVASVAASIMAYEHKSMGQRSNFMASPQEVQRFADEHYDEIRDSLSLVTPTQDALRVSRTALGTAGVLFSRKDPKLAEWFFGVLATGAMADGTMLTLRERIRTEKMRRGQNPSSTTIFYMLVRGWNNIRSGEDALQILKVPHKITGRNMIDVV